MHSCEENKKRCYVPGSDFQFELCIVCDKTRVDKDGEILFWSLSYEKRAMICDGDESFVNFATVDRDN